MNATETVAVDLPAGTVDVSIAIDVPSGSRVVLALAHGAGTGYDHPFLVGLAGALHKREIATIRFNFPYVQAGRRMPGPAAHAVHTWRAVEAAAIEAAPGLPFWACGKSYGGRMASMAAAEGEISPAGLIYIGYPLHPPGRPESPRVAHLPAITARQVFVSGTKDPFVDPHEQLEEAVASCQDATLHWVEGAGHSFEIAGRKRPADEIGADLAPLLATFAAPRV